MRPSTRTIATLSLAATAACASTDSAAMEGGSSSSSSNNSSSGAATSSDDFTAATGSTQQSGGSSTSDDGTDSSSGRGSGSASSTGDTPVTPSPVLPQPTGICPEIVNGDVTFAPAGVPARQVNMSLGDDSDATSSLIIYWHATGSAVTEAEYALGSTLGEFTGRGGIVAAPHADPSAGMFEWFVVNQSDKLDDFLLADEIIGCLNQAGMLDASKIHSMGMSAGALQTTVFSFLRSSYLASVATYSGGLPGGVQFPDEDPDNPLAALVFFGGAADTYGPLDFAEASRAYFDTLVANDRFAALCDHNGGHTIPLDAAPSVIDFFSAHSFGTSPSPYVGGLPASFPLYCGKLAGG